MDKKMGAPFRAWDLRLEMQGFYPIFEKDFAIMNCRLKNRLKKMPLLAMCFFVMGCQAKKSDALTQPTEIQWEPSPERAFESKRKQTYTQILAAPKLSGHKKTISGFEELKNLSSSVDMKVERAWRSADSRKVIVVLQNKTEKGTRANFYLFSHDERGLLIEVKQEEIFFNPNEVIYRSFSFKDSDPAKSWSMAVK